MKTITCIVLWIALGNTAFAQFYYKDVLLARQAQSKWVLYRDNKIKNVKIKSFEADNEPTNGFTCEQVISRNFLETSTHTKSSLSSESVLIADYDGNGLLKKTTDTGDRVQSVTEYRFDENARIISITNTTSQADSKLKDVELHLWTYDEKGNPVKMVKVKNGSDSTFVRFVLDEKGNVVEEHALRNRVTLPAIYYYYDDSRRLTDIVRYNTKAKRLLPDFVFEYDDLGRLTSMLTVPEDNNGYQKWIYMYNEKGLREKENCYSKEKKLLGRFEYEYGLF